MKLLYIHQYFKFPEQAGSTRSYDLATSFVKKNIDVIVISSITECVTGNNDKWTVFERDGIIFHMLYCPYNNNMSFGDRIRSFLKFMWNASIKAIKIKCDCVLVTSTPLTIAIPALIKKWFNKTPFIFEVRDVWPEIPIKMGIIKNKIAIKLLYWFEKLVYKNANFIVPLSVGMDSNIKLRYPNKKSVVIPNISEIKRFATVKQVYDFGFSVENKKIVLYAGTFGHVNGIQYVVDLAIQTLKIDPDVWFFLFGKGKEKNDIKKYAYERQVLNKNIFIFDSVGKCDLPYLYSISTVGSSFVIDNPVLWDNSANKFFDTLAASKPIVINHLGWQAETIKDYNVGFILPSKVTKEAAEKFVKYINNEKLLKIQSENALSLARNSYSLDVAVNKYMMIFSQFL